MRSNMLKLAGGSLCTRVWVSCSRRVLASCSENRNMYTCQSIKSLLHFTMRLSRLCNTLVSMHLIEIHTDNERTEMA